MSTTTVLPLLEVADVAADMGCDGAEELRFLTADLGTTGVGATLHRIRPGARQPFGHRHHAATNEEVYVVLAGSGRLAAGDVVHELQRLDAVLVPAPLPRAMEAGPDGMEVLVFGTRHDADGELEMGWWPDQPAVT
ncbi:hypothetical protein [Conexibacter sp. SYSU D00693]|uniref:cupin domain-containing protein n=1 Tax=Conexibacter sp. SYSU D00693 TaxID=2812560 RepID=UPI00196AC3F6|nr:hypothetical protein [Conexibacter sp. SYSU D00693]